MRCTIILFMFLSSLIVHSQEGSEKPSKGEFYIIKEAYLFKNDSTYSLKESFVDQPSKVFIMFGSDSSIVISIDHGNDKVIYLGFAEEVEDPGQYDFLKGQKTFYDWSFNVHDSKEPQECLVIKEYVSDVKDMVSKEYFRFHFLFDEEQIMFYCDMPIIHVLNQE